MLSETLVAGLAHYAIGPKIRALRHKKKLGLVQLANTPVCHPACCPNRAGRASFPRCRHCSGFRSCSG